MIYNFKIGCLNIPNSSRFTLEILKKNEIYLAVLAGLFYSKQTNIPFFKQLTYKSTTHIQYFWLNFEESAIS
jgi:hypothetical protein